MGRGGLGSGPNVTPPENVGEINMAEPAALLRGNIPSIVTLAAGAFFFLSIPSEIVLLENEGQSGVNARTMPYLIAGGIIVLSLYTIVSNAIGNLKETATAQDGEPREATAFGRVLLAFIAIALWIVILPYLGYNVATMLLVASIMLIIRDCRWWQIVVLAVMLSVPINYLLAIVLRVYLPAGSLFE